MFHTSHIHVPRNRRPSALRTFIASSSFGPPDTKEPLRRGILLTAVAFVLLLIGSILTWLGFNDVFGGRMSMTGPLLIALSLLLLLLSFRQFLLARKRNSSNGRSSMQLDSVAGENMTAVVVNRDDGLHPATIIVDRYHRMPYDTTLTVHRHVEEDCAPPPYHEVTQLSSSNNTLSGPMHDIQDELPPTYEETMGSSIYPPASTIPSPYPIPERSRRIPSSGAVSVSGAGGSRLAQVTERDMSQNNAALPVRGMFSQKHSAPVKPVVPCLRLDGGRGMVRQGVGVGGCGVTAPVLPVPQHSLAIPHAQHMSAPASPRQLSAPPSPHPFSAPPSPRHLSLHQNGTPPPQYMSPSGSSLQLTPSPSLHVLSVSPSHTFSSQSPSSPHFSAPSSPRLAAGQHSLTPPPQYTSTPPSPRQVSGPPSPHILTSPHSPNAAANFLPMHPLPVSVHAFPSSSPSSHHVAGSSHPSFSASQCANAWTSHPTPTSHDGYTCFTYNLVTPLPMDNSPVPPPRHPHTSAYLAGDSMPLSHPPHNLCEPRPHQGDARSWGVGEGRPYHRTQVQMNRVGAHPGFRGESDVAPGRDGSSRGDARSQSNFTSRTDIQANI